MQKRGLPVYLISGGVIIYILSILMPWFTFGLGYFYGFEFRSYLLLIAFIYPLYTIIRNVPIHQTYGLFSAIIPAAVLVVLYFSFTGKNEELGIAVARATFGYYTALIGCLLVLIAVFMKLRRQGMIDTEKDE